MSACFCIHILSITNGLFKCLFRFNSFFNFIISLSVGFVVFQRLPIAYSLVLSVKASDSTSSYVDTTYAEALSILSIYSSLFFSVTASYYTSSYIVLTSTEASTVNFSEATGSSVLLFSCFSK